MAVQAISETPSNDYRSNETADNAMTEPNNILPMTINSEIAEDVDTELESIRVVRNNSKTNEAAGDIEMTSGSEGQSVDPVNSESEGGNNGDSEINIGINIDQRGENVPTHETALQLITRAIPQVGALTVHAVVHVAHSEPASGLGFGHNKLVYNLTLAAIFAIGVAEIFTGIWISMSSLTYMRRLLIGGIVLFLSIWPLVGILNIGSFA